MAIPGFPQNVSIQTANANNLILWDIVAGATSYALQRSLDGVTFTTLATPTSNSYLDAAVTVGLQYWYQVASVNGSGASIYATPGLNSPSSVVPAPISEMSLLSLRLASKQKADRVGSQFVTNSEWNTFIDLAMYELYDMLITCYDMYNVATPLQFLSDGVTFLYPLPNGVTSYINGVTQAPGYIAPPFYKLLGIDLGLNSANNAYVTVNNFNFVDRNRFVFPNTASTIYGVFNLQYMIVGSNIMFIPTPSSNQVIRMWFIPRLTAMLQDTDYSSIGISGWLQYVIVRAAKYALDKEESDSSKLDAELLFLKTRIEETAPNRDAGMASRISDVRGSGYYWGTGMGFNGGSAGF
jgi:hypothetical protein